jgi:hypothetical protein
VDSVELKLEAGEIHVRLGHAEMIDWPCPECGAACATPRSSASWVGCGPRRGEAADVCFENEGHTEGRWILKKLGSTEFREGQMNKRRAVRVIMGMTLTAQIKIQQS